jgi:hypothetical protein
VAYELIMKIKRGEIAVETGADPALAYVLGPGGAWLWTVLGLTAAVAGMALYATDPRSTTYATSSAPSTSSSSQATSSSRRCTPEATSRPP